MIRDAAAGLFTALACRAPCLKTVNSSVKSGAGFALREVHDFLPQQRYLVFAADGRRIAMRAR